MQSRQTVWFHEVDKEDVGLVGGKGANLGEMTKAGFPVPNGFIVTSRAYFAFIKENGLQQRITHLLGTVNLEQPDSLQQVAKHIKKLIISGELSEELVSE